MLHPVMPYVTEEIWQNLSKLCPQRGFESIAPATESISIAAWPELDTSWSDESIEGQFGLFQSALGAIREIRASQNIGKKQQVNFVVRCQPDVATSLEPLGRFFGGMAKATMTAIGPDVETPEINAVMTKGPLEILVDLDGLIDPAAEVKRLEKELASLEKSIGGKQRQLSNEKFVAAKPELAEEIRASLNPSITRKDEREAWIVAQRRLSAKADALGPTVWQFAIRGYKMHLLGASE